MKHCANRICIGLTLLSGLSLAHGQTSELVADINAGDGPVVSSAPRSFVTIGNGLALFVAFHPSYGRELWRTDGTTQGTQLVADIHPGHESGNPSGLTVNKSQVFFSADNGTHGYELWVTDGTGAGTRMVRDISPGRPTSFVRQLTAFDGEVYFQARDPVIGAELWKSDGTEGGTVRVTDLVPGAGSSTPSALTVVDRVLMFSAYREVEGREFWRVDGDGNLALVADVNPGPDSSVGPFESAAGVVNGLLVIAADDGQSGKEPWVLDPGEPRNTRRLADIAPGPDDGCCSNFVLSEGLLYFRAAGTTPGLWSTDGRAVSFIAELEGDFAYPVLSWNGLTAIYCDTEAFGTELWVSDGSAAGTMLLKDINPGPANASPRGLTAIGGTLFFSAIDAGGERELWRSDGTTVGTVPVKNINGAQSGLPAVSANGTLNGELLLSAQEATSGVELWLSDGSADGTVQLANIARDRESAQVANLTRVNQRVVFTAFRADLGAELWASDGASVEILSDTLPGSDSGLESTHLQALPMLKVADTLFFLVDTDPSGLYQDLWRTDGSASGTRRVTDFNSDAFPGDFRLGGVDQPTWASLEDRLYVMVDGDEGKGLYEVDPANDAVTFIAEAAYDEAAYLGPNMAATQEYLFYASSADTALRRSDGTAAGTAVVADIGTPPRWLTATSSRVFFLGGVTDVWRSDGSSGGTFPVTSFAPGGANSFPRFLTAHDDSLFFVANDGASGYELWVSDGSVAGTRVVKDINPGPDSSRPFALTSSSAGLYFAAYTASGGVELWLTDGSQAGTRQVADIVSGSASGLPWPTGENDFPAYVLVSSSAESPLLPAIDMQELPDGRMAFSAWDPGGGSELWITDGTPVGTLPLTAIAPGTQNANPAFLTALDDVLVFSADDGVRGRELWKIDLAGFVAGTLFADGFE